MRCSVCGKQLKSHESEERGMGPVCAKKHGVKLHKRTLPKIRISHTRIKPFARRKNINYIHQLNLIEFLKEIENTEILEEA